MAAGQNYTTIPEAFRMRGYHTVGMGKIFHGGEASGCSHCQPKLLPDDAGLGPGTYSLSEPYWMPKDDNYPLDHFGGTQTVMVINQSTAEQHPLPDVQTADHAVEQIQRLSRWKHKPIFLGVGFRRPHLPFVVPEETMKMYSNKADIPTDDSFPVNGSLVGWSNWCSIEVAAYDDIKEAKAAIPELCTPRGPRLPQAKIRHMRQAYYAAVTHVDEQIGKVLAAWEASPLGHDSIIVLWADHGYQLGEHGEWAKHTNFELAVHTPFMIHIGSLTDGGVVTDAYTEHVDIFPTMYEAAFGQHMPPCPVGHMQIKTNLCTMGRSRLPLIVSPNLPDSAAFSQYARPYFAPGSPPNTNISWCNPGAGVGASSACTMGYSVVTALEGEEYRYTEWVDYGTQEWHAPDWTSIRSRELYLHGSAVSGFALQEKVNLAYNPEYQDIVQYLGVYLRAGPKTGGGWGPWQGNANNQIDV